MLQAVTSPKSTKLYSNFLNQSWGVEHFDQNSKAVAIANQTAPQASLVALFRSQNINHTSEFLGNHINFSFVQRLEHALPKGQILLDATQKLFVLRAFYQIM